MAEALAEKGLAEDSELATLAEGVKRALLEAKVAAVPGAADIEVESVRGRINATVERLVAAGRIKLWPIIAEEGDATVRDVSAGTQGKKA